MKWPHGGWAVPECDPGVTLTTRFSGEWQVDVGLVVESRFPGIEIEQWVAVDDDGDVYLPVPVYRGTSAYAFVQR